MSDADRPALSAFLRSNQAFHAQLTRPESLSCGQAFCVSAWPQLADANQVRDLLLLDQSIDAALTEIDSHFTARGSHCRRIALSIDQPIEPIRDTLQQRGWEPRRNGVQVLDAWPGVDSLRPDDEQTSAGIRVLPSRAMRKAYIKSYESQYAGLPTLLAGHHLEAAAERLNNAEYDSFVALQDQNLLGRAVLFQTGDIAALREFWVADTPQAEIAARAMLRHALHLSYRLGPRIVVADGGRDDRTDGASERHAALMREFAFVPAGELLEWERDD